jgi:hypothetical protein
MLKHSEMHCKWSAKPLFSGSNPLAASNNVKGLQVFCDPFFFVLTQVAVKQRSFPSHAKLDNPGLLDQVIYYIKHHPLRYVDIHLTAV